MKNLLICFFLIGISINTYAEDIKPNPAFDIGTALPNDFIVNSMNYPNTAKVGYVLKDDNKQILITNNIVNVNLRKYRECVSAKSGYGKDYEELGKKICNSINERHNREKNKFNTAAYAKLSNAEKSFVPVNWNSKRKKDFTYIKESDSVRLDFYETFSELSQKHKDMLKDGYQVIGASSFRDKELGMSDLMYFIGAVGATEALLKFDYASPNSKSVVDYQIIFYVKDNSKKVNSHD